MGEKNKPIYTIADLKQRQSLPLEAKIVLAQQRIRQWYEYWDGKVCISFSGGKDSTVLLHLIREMYPEVVAVYADTGLEYPEIRQFAKTFDNVVMVRPKKSFVEVVTQNGYPVVSKDVARQTRYAKKGSKWALNNMAGINKDGSYSRFKASHYSQWKHLVDAPFPISDACCEIIKEKPIHEWQKEHGMHTFVGTMAEESTRRTTAWLETGCNVFNDKGVSKPLSVWTEQDVLRYIKQNNIQIASVYGDIVEDPETGKLRTTKCQRTGCMFCAFGAHLEKNPNRFERLKETHPKQYEFCMKPVTEGGLGMDQVLTWMGIAH